MSIAEPTPTPDEASPATKLFQYAAWLQRQIPNTYRLQQQPRRAVVDLFKLLTAHLPNAHFIDPSNDDIVEMQAKQNIIRVIDNAFVAVGFALHNRGIDPQRLHLKVQAALDGQRLTTANARAVGIVVFAKYLHDNDISIDAPYLASQLAGAQHQLSPSTPSQNSELSLEKQLDAVSRLVELCNSTDIEFRRRLEDFCIRSPHHAQAIHTYPATSYDIWQRVKRNYELIGVVAKVPLIQSAFFDVEHRINTAKFAISDAVQSKLAGEIKNRLKIIGMDPPAAHIASHDFNDDTPTRLRRAINIHGQHLGFDL